MASLSLIPVMAAPAVNTDPSTTFDEWCLKYFTDPTFADGPEYTSEENRILAMGAPKNSNEFYEIYIDSITGEVAIKDKTTGDVLFSNPFDITEVSSSSVVLDEGSISAGASSSNTSNRGGKKGQILSQVEISYNALTATSSTGKSEYNSFKDAALYKQIDIKRLDGGVRVEYSIGLEDARTLVPRVFNVDRFEWMLETIATNLGVDPDIPEYTDAYRNFNLFRSFYQIYERATMMIRDKDSIETTEKLYPAFKEMDLAVLNPDINASELRRVQSVIKMYCPEYTFEDLDRDHEEAQWVVVDKQPANFRMALEYYLTSTGVEVRFPANGLTFDESQYSLNQISILKYMGSGTHDYNGYTFIPDGSGTLVRFEDVTDMCEIPGKIYGEDYAYQEVANQNQEVYRMPVFGVVVSDELQGENAPVYRYTPVYAYAVNDEGVVASAPNKYEGFPRTSNSLPADHGDLTIKVPIFDPYGNEIPEAAQSYEIKQGAPVKEVVASIPVYDYEKNPDGSLATELDENGNEVYKPLKNADGSWKIRGYASYTIGFDTPVIKNYIPVYKAEKTHSTGYFAIVTEGEALTTIVSNHGAKGRDHFYNSVFCTFKPRPKDSYNLSEAISVGKNTEYTVVSERKYTGSFRIQYFMLTDPEVIAEQVAAGSTRTFYETSYVGMANAYRDYLKGNGSIQKLTDTKEDIPLFIESFGKTEDEDTFLSIPITVDVALTSFDNLKSMVKELNKNNITNINFKLTGFTNGGMIPTVPTKVDFEKVVGGDDGFVEFLEYATKNGVGVYPDFDFAYMMDTAWFDGFSYDDDAVKTIDNRYITKREYDAVLQTFATTGKICISPSVYSDFFEDFHDSMTDILEDIKDKNNRKTNVSLSTLGSDLNSDFDEDEPYNREDSKAFTVQLLKQFATNKSYNKIMVDAGNAYAIPYASIVLNAPLDSSRFLNTSESIPFFGMVYHSYLVYAGAPTNMAGDMQYEKLKIIENGATLYMMLSYGNVEILKEDEVLSKYYAISFEHWKSMLFSQPILNENNEVIGTKLGIYDELNALLKDVQNSEITNHKFIDCKRQFSPAEEANLRAIAQANYNAKAATLKAAMDKAVAKVALYDRVTAEFAAKVLTMDDIYAVIAAYADADLDSKVESALKKVTGVATGIYAAELEVLLKDEAAIKAVVDYFNKKAKDITQTSEYKALMRDINDLSKQIADAEEGADVSLIQQQLDEKNAALETLKVENGYYDFLAQVEKFNAYADTNAKNIANFNDKVARLNAYFGENTTKADLDSAAATTTNACNAYTVNEVGKEEEYAILAADYEDNKIIDDGSVVYVEYTNPVTKQIKWFVLNYNDYKVDVDVVFGGIAIKGEISANGYITGYAN